MHKYVRGVKYHWLISTLENPYSLDIKLYLKNF